MQVATTNTAGIEPIHWVHVKKPLAYSGLASDSYSLLDKSGKLSLFLSGKQKLTAEGAPYLCATVPGFTGDAETHNSLIERSLANGVGVVCVTPTWSSVTSEMQGAFDDLLVLLKDGPVSVRGLQFIRANSFGAFLALGWVASLTDQLRKVAFVTPCSADQLPNAGELIGTPVKNDLRTRAHIHLQKLSVRVISLMKDSVVPESDPLFLSLSTRTEVLTSKSSDHFTAGDLKIASEDIADWFSEGL